MQQKKPINDHVSRLASGGTLNSIAFPSGVLDEIMKEYVKFYVCNSV